MLAVDPDHVCLDEVSVLGRCDVTQERRIAVLVIEGNVFNPTYDVERRIAVNGVIGDAERGAAGS
jgi:hypothetical protein